MFGRGAKFAKARVPQASGRSAVALTAHSSLFPLKIALSQLSRWREKFAKDHVLQAPGRSAGVSHCSLLSLLSSKGILVPKIARNHALFPLDRRYM